MAMNDDDDASSPRPIPSISASNYRTVAQSLTKVRKLVYRTAVIENEKPRPVATIWQEVVSLFTPPQEGSPQTSEESPKQDLSPNNQFHRNPFKEWMQEACVLKSVENSSTEMQLPREEAELATPTEIAADLPGPVNNEGYPAELQKLAGAFKNDHFDETKFYMALFDALYEALVANQLVEARHVDATQNDQPDETQFEHTPPSAALQQGLTAKQLVDARSTTASKPKEKWIVFKYGKTASHAIAVAREVSGEEGRPDPGRRLRLAMILEKRGNSRGLVANAKYDHCPCLLEKNGKGKWELVDCFSNVELKMHDSNSCTVFDRRAKIHKQLQLENQHGSIAQSMLYCLRWTLPSLARIGQLGTEIPWVVIVAKRLRSEAKEMKNEAEHTVSNRWVSGNIYVPNECGDPFQYAVTGYGGRMDEVATVDSVLDALSVYLETILFGLKAAKVCLDFRANHHGRWPDACSVSGKQVVMFGRTIPLELRASATVGKFPNQNTHDRHWDAAQGELFTGKLNIANLYASLTEVNKAGFVVFNKMGTKMDADEADVVVQVSSKAVHNVLTDPDQNWETLKSLSSLPAASVVSKVLYAMYRKPVGFITIMADLSLENYKVLRPKTCGASIPYLWKALEVVVCNVLVPLANLEMIHADIRPGWDVTSNILCQVVDEHEVGKSVSMQVIDYESVVWLWQWESPRGDHRYVERDPAWNALTYLWWQCANLAISWNGMFSQERMISFDVQDFVDDGNWNECFPEVDVPGNVKLTEATFKTHLEALGKIFASMPPHPPVTMPSDPSETMEIIADPYAEMIDNVEEIPFDQQAEMEMTLVRRWKRRCLRLR